MALQSRSLKADLIWLRLPLAIFLILCLSSVGLFFGATVFNGNAQRQELIAAGDLDILNNQVQVIAESERIIVENIESFNAMANNSVMDVENRVAILQEIAVIRDRHQLFPIDVEISEQERNLLAYNEFAEFPEEEISLRGSIVSINLPLLHEGDLTNFLDDFISTGRLIVPSNCVITDLVVEERDLLRLVPHQIANCQFYWYTFRRELFGEDP